MSQGEGALLGCCTACSEFRVPNGIFTSCKAVLNRLSIELVCAETIKIRSMFLMRPIIKLLSQARHLRDGAAVWRFDQWLR